LTNVELHTLRAEVRAWLGENVPKDLALPGPDDDISPELEAWTIDFRRKLGAKGWLAPSWPKHFGGGGLPPQAGAAIMEEVGRMRLPPLSLSMTFLVPLRAWGTEEQKAKWLVPTLRGEITVSQIQSEPSTGTDLATQATTAIREGDEYVVNGEKGFTATPLMPDYIFILVTTDPQGPKYQNLSMILLNARDPGVTINSRKMVTGKSQRSFVIKDVRVPLEDVIGGEGGGWDVAQTLLDVERGGMGITLAQRQEIEESERKHWGGAAQ
jgi:alkylation response protein AidB-like acyl-CoA dehydrogenase